MENNLIQILPDKVWVGWKKVLINGEIRKQPKSINGSASSTDPETWDYYGNIKNKIGTMFDGAGYIISQEHTKIIGVDLDHVLKDGKIIRDDVLEFLIEANTYTEISPSGDGLHVIFSVEDSQKMKANKHTNDDGTKFECYSDGRYFTFTGKIYHTYNEIANTNFDKVEKLLGILGYPWGKGVHISAIAKTPSLPSFDDEKVLSLMFSSKNGEKIKKLYNGDISQHNEDYSSADLSLCSNLAFFSGNQIQVERIWMASPLGNRKKTQERADYRKMTVTKAFAGKTEFYNPAQAVIPVFLSGKHTNQEKPEFIGKKAKDGSIIVKPVFENIKTIMLWDSEFSDNLAYNMFTDKIEYKGKSKQDIDDIYILSKLQRKYPELSDIQKHVLIDAIYAVAYERRYNPVVDWLKSLKWDGESRVESMIDDVFGYPQEDNESFFNYRKAVSINLMKSLVGRALEPGIKYDHMIVIEGKQGCGKSTFVQALVGADYLYETIAKDITQKDFFMCSQKAWVVHFDEGESLKYNSVEALKHVITSQIDTRMKPYARNETTVAKKNIYIMSTNDAQYLRDKTGNRRFLPIKVYLDFVDIGFFRKHREQLFAEAVHLFQTDKTFDIPTKEAEKQQEARVILDPIDEMVEDYVDSLSEDYLIKSGIDSKEVYESRFNREVTRIELMNINQAFIRLGFEQKRVLDTKTKQRIRKWFLKENYKA